MFDDTSSTFAGLIEAMPEDSILAPEPMRAPKTRGARTAKEKLEAAVRKRRGSSRRSIGDTNWTCSASKTSAKDRPALFADEAALINKFIIQMVIPKLTIKSANCAFKTKVLAPNSSPRLALK